MLFLFFCFEKYVIFVKKNLIKYVSAIIYLKVLICVFELLMEGRRMVRFFGSHNPQPKFELYYTHI